MGAGRAGGGSAGPLDVPSQHHKHRCHVETTKRNCDEVQLRGKASKRCKRRVNSRGAGPWMNGHPDVSAWIGNLRLGIWRLVRTGPPLASGRARPMERLDRHRISQPRRLARAHQDVERAIHPSVHHEVPVTVVDGGDLGVHEAMGRERGIGGCIRVQRRPRHPCSRRPVAGYNTRFAIAKVLCDRIGA